MKAGLQSGHIGRLNWTVGPEHVIHLGAEAGAGAVVFATPSMINLMEHAAREALRPFLESGEESVGMKIEVEHIAPTPIAAAVQGEAEVTRADGKVIDFEVRAYDGQELIGRGTHRRAVIGMDRFAANLKKKSQQLPDGMVTPMPIQPNADELPAFSTLLVERQGQRMTVTLDRPKQLNAVNSRMTEEFEQLVAWLAGHEDVRVVILTGAGRAFCAGDDVKEVASLSPEAATQLSLRQARMYLAFEQLPQPIIAAVNGHCLGGGCVCAYSCDFRIASTAAIFGMPEIMLGWPPGYGVAQLTALIGKARALQMCLTGRSIDARTAREWGLVHEVVPQNRLMAEAEKLADALLATPPKALRETKRLIHFDEGVRPKTTHLADTAAYIRCLHTEDAAEGIAAFAEKRKPQFRDR